MLSPNLQPVHATMDARLQALVTDIASCLVTHPNHLRVAVAAGPQSVVVSVGGHRADTGCLLGKDCKHKNAMEAMVKFVTRRDVRVTICEGHVGEKSPPSNCALTERWSPADNERLEQAVTRIAEHLFPNAKNIVTIQSAGFDSIVTVRVSPHAELQQAFYDVFRAWGRRHGRRVRVELGDERQTA